MQGEPDLPAATERAVAEAALADSQEPPAGSIVVLDEAGGEHARESGSITVHAKSGSPGTLQTILVNEGKWDPRQTPDGDYYIRQIRLRDREAILTTFQDIIFEGKTATAIQCRWLATASLHVVDDASGTELDAVTLYYLDNVYNSNTEFPIGIVGAQLIGEGLASPIPMEPLPGGTGAVTLFAYRDNYSWGRLLFDRTGGGDQFIKLQPGADVTVDVVGAEATADMTIRLWRGSAKEKMLLAERARRDLTHVPRRARFLGLPAGGYEVTLERGPASESQRLAAQAIQVEGTRDVSLEVSIPPLPADRNATVRLKVRIDPTWDLSNFQVVITDQDLPSNDPGGVKRVRSARMTRADSSTYLSEPINVRSARHKLFIPEANFGSECFVAQTDQEQELVLELPACCHIALHVISARTGEPIESPKLCWSSVTNMGTIAGEGCVSVNSIAPGRVEFRAPPGKLHLSVSAGDVAPYLMELRRIDVVPGPQELLVELAPASVVSFAIYDGERQLEWTSDVLGRIAFRTPSGPAKAQRTGMDTRTGLMTCVLQEATKYVVSIPKLPGYLPVEEFEVDLTTGPVEHRVIQLVREK
ncbi:MAG: hypothetical protein IPK67_00810 [Planctomycetes bacterium]|nr:hypothetical protein [Planctomycetota bacterium]